MTAINKYPKDVISESAQTEVDDVKAQLTQILPALEDENIDVLPEGSLERHLPLSTCV